MVEVKVRSPTGRAWLLFLLAFVVAGELFYEVRQPATAHLVGVPFTDGELIPWITGFAVAALAGLAWLLRLHLAPGVLRVSSEQVERICPGLWRSRRVAAPTGQWSIHLSYFTAERRERGLFKRLRLEGPDWIEVLLFADCRDGEALARAIESVASELGELRVEVEN
jgi:hypothetical protein